MLEKLTLQNFRAFKDATIEFAPITILAGANSSGKSSVLQAINGVLQSKGERGFPFDFVLNGELTQLGAYRNVIHGHNAKNSFGVGIHFSNSDRKFSASGVFKVADDSKSLFPRNVSVSVPEIGSFVIDWNQKKQNFKIHIDVKDSYASQSTPKWASAFIEMLKAEGQSGQGALSRLLVESQGEGEDSISLAKVKDLFMRRIQEMREGVTSGSSRPDEALEEFASLALFAPMREALAKGLSSLRSSISYIGPVRAYPARYYALAKQRAEIDPFGESLSHMLALWKEVRSEKFQEVKKALVQLELATDLGAELELSEFLKVMVKPKGRLFPDSLADVGFGVSQALPVLVADTALDQGGTLMVNQPEIHLHPSSQALLANYFAGRLDRRRFVIETHSEYLINRLRLLVARGDLREDDVALYYFGTDTESSSTRTSRVRMRKTGELEGMPEDFFTTYAADTFQMAMTVMEDEEDAKE